MHRLRHGRRRSSSRRCSQIVSRNVDPLDSAVISICEFHAGDARNVIPQTAELRGTVRTLTPEVSELIEKRVREVCGGHGADHRRQDRSRATSTAIP